MLYALILLGLLPAVFLPEIMSKDDDPENEEPMRDTSHDTDLFGVEESGDELHIADDVSSSADAPSPAPGETEMVVPDQPPDDAATDPADPILVPVIEADHPSQDQTMPAEVLDPVIEDDLASDEPNNDLVLNPKVEDDHASAETFVTYSGANGAAEIPSFDPNLDILRISMGDSFEGDLLDVQVNIAENGTDSLVSVDGLLLAILKDQIDVNASHIAIEIMGSA